MEDNTTLELIITKASRGDHKAFRAVFDAASDKVFRYLLSQTRSREDALDLLQECFIDLWKALPRFTYQSDEEFWGFLFTIAKRKVAAFREKRSRNGTPFEQEILEVLIPIDEHIHPEFEDHRSLYGAIAKLSDASREILTLRYWSELSFKEIAAAVNISEGAAKVRHHRAIAELRSYIHLS